ncbi:DUF2339 domain-containing protein [Methylomonas sp. MED-D]|uniref:DUF2339 domain-containing protein n=1 Tax=unclassified Methylomonas TaxID=2608980 RepID=UPI0028A4FBA3|nr:DUF2339 domain-containing protein [Methylomonas sp. MV1]MDT4329748.1 DUF2339 domain-containing protein [Methylomonas sp. MV1]
MDDIFELLAVVAVVVPIVVIVLLVLLLNRQREINREIKDSLADLHAALREDRKLLLTLTERVGTERPAAAPASFDAQTPAREQILFEPRAASVETTAPEPSRAEPADTEPTASTPAPNDAWQTAGWQVAEPSRFELAARQALQQIWNWIVVGEGHRPDGVSIEYAVASNWLLRIGVLILVTGIGFFLKYSIDNGLLGEQARVALSVLTGLAMIVGGVRLVGGQYHLFSQGLLGGGIAVLYFSVFAAYAFYHLLGAYPAFGLMLTVTASAAALAIRLDAMLVAIFAIIGGYCTPILLSTGQVNFVGLFSYMLLLGGGILAVNWYKQWHVLNFLGFAFNYLLFFAAMQRYESGYFWQVLPFLTGFFVLYSTTVFLFCLVNRQRSTLLDLVALAVNAAIYFGTAYELIATEYGQVWTALPCLALSAFYVGHVYYCLARRIEDRELVVGFIGLAAFFLSVAVPLILSKQWITVSWSLQALVMIWMAGKVRSAFLRQTAYLLYLLVVARYAFIDLPGQYAEGATGDAAPGEFWFGLIERLVSFGIPILSMALAYTLIEKPAPATELACSPAQDVPVWLKDGGVLAVIALIVVALVFVTLQLELYRSLAYLYPPLQAPALTLVWLGLGALLLNRYMTGSGQLMLAGLRWLLIGLAIKLTFFDLPSWGLTLGHAAIGDSLLTLHYGGTYRFESALMRLLDFGAIILFLALAFRRLEGDEGSAADVRRWLGTAALVLLFAFLSLETNSLLLHYLPGLRSGGVTILWSLFALTSVYHGIRREVAALRLAGLVLFAIVAWKVFFVDLARLEQIYRIVAFIVLGMLVLGGAFFYMRYRQNFAANAETESKR